jgi:hypothetical protein
MGKRCSYFSSLLLDIVDKTVDNAASLASHAT